MEDALKAARNASLNISVFLVPKGSLVSWMEKLTLEGVLHANTLVANVTKLLVDVLPALMGIRRKGGSVSLTPR